MMQTPSPIQKIQTPWTEKAGISLWLKREDLIHPQLSGNKYRKLKYNLLEAKQQKKTKIVSFGGAFSNHIHALAFACQEVDLQSIGIIRGEQSSESNPTLRDAKKWGMDLHFVDRNTYKTKNTAAFIEKIKLQFDDFYLIPEGGTNQLAIKGTSEVIGEIDFEFDYLCTAIGTGGTIAGLIRSCPLESKILGFSALKGDFILEEVAKLLDKKYANYTINTDFHFGGYAKTRPELLDFIADFYTNTQVQLEPIYTGKMLFGIKTLAQSGFFPKNSKIIALHTGGLQGFRAEQRN